MLSCRFLLMFYVGVFFLSFGKFSRCTRWYWKHFVCLCFYFNFIGSPLMMCQYLNHFGCIDSILVAYFQSMYSFWLMELTSFGAWICHSSLGLVTIHVVSSYEGKAFPYMPSQLADGTWVQLIDVTWASFPVFCRWGACMQDDLLFLREWSSKQIQFKVYFSPFDISFWSLSSKSILNIIESPFMSFFIHFLYFFLQCYAIVFSIHLSYVWTYSGSDVGVFLYV
jgi:hypothetical protein